MDKNSVRIPFKNAFTGLASRRQFEQVLEKVRGKLESLDIKALYLNNVEMLDIQNTLECLKSMSVNEVIASELLIHLA